MEHFDYKHVTRDNLNLAVKDIAEALSLYEQEQYVPVEKKIAEVIYRLTTVLHLINREIERDLYYTEKLQTHKERH